MTLHIRARRWFDKTYGNTYHSVVLVKDGAEVARNPFAYGYDEHYLVTAGMLAAEHGLLADLLDKPASDADYGDLERAGYAFARWQYLKEHGITHEVVDVSRRRDL